MDHGDYNGNASERAWYRFVRRSIVGLQSILGALVVNAAGPLPGPPPVPAELTDATNSASVIPASENLFGDWGGARARASEWGLDWGLEYIGEVLGNVAGGLRREAIYEGLLKVAVDVDCEKLVRWPGAQFHVSGLFPHGKSLTRRCLGDLFTLSNIDAAEGVRLFEFWLQQEFQDHKVSLRVGQLAADEEFAGTDYGGLFINGTCGWPAIIALNAPSPAYPLAAPGARLGLELGEHFHFQTAIYAGNPDPPDANGNCTNPHGTSFSFDDGALVLAELTSRWQPKSNQLPGTAKLGGWWHSGDFDHVHQDNLGLCLANPASTGVPRRLHGNWGFYLAAQQQVWRERGGADDDAQGLRVFSRLGGSPADRNLLQLYLEGGVNYLGLIPGRDADECGVAVVFGRVSEEARRLAGELNVLTGSHRPLPDYEAVVEAAYRFALRPGWSLQPCLEYIIHPGGSAAYDNAVVVGVRTQFNF